MFATDHTTGIFFDIPDKFKPFLEILHKMVKPLKKWTGEIVEAYMTGIFHVNKPQVKFAPIVAKLTKYNIY